MRPRIAFQTITINPAFFIQEGKPVKELSEKRGFAKGGLGAGQNIVVREAHEHRAFLSSIRQGPKRVSFLEERYEWKSRRESGRHKYNDTQVYTPISIEDIGVFRN